MVGKYKLAAALYSLCEKTEKNKKTNKSKARQNRSVAFYNEYHDRLLNGMMDGNARLPRKAALPKAYHLARRIGISAMSSAYLDAEIRVFRLYCLLTIPAS